MPETVEKLKELLDKDLKIIEEKNKEILRLTEENILLRASEPMSKLLEDYGYKATVDKAIEYIEKLKNFKIKYVMLEEKELYATENDFVKDLLEILKGENKE